MKNAVIYARYSSESQTDQSIDGQLRVCYQYAKQNDLHIIDTYIDKAMTGTNDQRDAFQQMLADSEKPVAWDIVLVYAIDRFGRNSIEIAMNKQRLAKNNKLLISATQRTSVNIDGTKNLDGILLENVYIGIAEYYSAELSQKVKRGIKENREKGLFCGGVILYGFKVENKKVLIDEPKAEIVRYIFQQYSNGVIARLIVDDLTKKGVYRKENKPFTERMIFDMLRNERYIGIHHTTDGTYTNIYPAIVPKGQFDLVQAILAKNHTGSHSVKVDYLLKGKLECGYCHKNIQGETGTCRNKTVNRYYKCVGRKDFHICNKSIFTKDFLEKTVLDYTIELLSNEENLNAIADGVIKANKKRITDKSVLKSLKDEKQKINNSIENLLVAIESGILTKRTKNRMEELEQRSAEIDCQIMIEEDKLKNVISKERVLQFITHTLRQTPQLLVFTLIKKIIVYDDKIAIRYNFIDNQSPDSTPPEDERGISLALNGSSFICSGAPNRTNSNHFVLVTHKWIRVSLFV